MEHWRFIYTTFKFRELIVSTLTPKSAVAQEKPHVVWRQQFSHMNGAGAVREPRFGSSFRDTSSIDSIILDKATAAFCLAGEGTLDGTENDRLLQC